MLAHASLFVTMNKRSATEVVNRFYRLLGSGSEYRDEAMVTVRDCLGRDAADESKHSDQALVEDMRRLLLNACKQAVTD